MKVLVTGATGFVGQHVVPKLIERGHSVIAAARDEARARAFSWFDMVRFVRLDIRGALSNPADLLGKPDAVMHLAWPGLSNYASHEHVAEYLPRAYGFLKSLVEDGVGHVLVTGTCLEYGMQSGGLSESACPMPGISYALAKDALRGLLESLQGEQPFTLQWLRLFYMYGPGQNPQSLLAQLDRAIDNREPVFNMSGGEQLRDYLRVEEVARRIVLLIEHPECHGVVNICSGKPISVHKLVEQRLAERGAQIKLNLGHYAYPDYEPMAFWGIGEKFQSISSDG